MKIISEQTIENVIDSFEEGQNEFLNLRDEMVETQLAFSAVLTDESLDVLKDEEYDLLWFMVTVIYGSIKKAHSNLPVIKPKAYEKAEELNWNTWNHSKGKNFRDKLDVFFEGFEQEDLLAFVEDSLESDEEYNISNTGREVIFIICKTMLDVFDTAITEN